MRRISIAFSYVVVASMGFLAGGGMAASAYHGHPAPAIIPAPDHWVETKLTPQEQKIRSSSVIVVSPGGYGSGSYVKWRGYHLVFTAHHVVRDWGGDVPVLERNSAPLPAKVVYEDERNDIAVLLLPGPMATRDPLRLKRGSGGQVGTRVIYTANPNFNDLVSLEGRIVAQAPGGRLYMHGFGWFGASGSGIFDHRGRLVGILTALDLGSFGEVQMPLEDLVVVSPVALIDFGQVLVNLAAEVEVENGLGEEASTPELGMETCDPE